MESTSNPEAVQEFKAQLQESLFDSDDIGDVLGALTVTAARVLSTDQSPVTCSVTLLQAGKPGTVSSSSADAVAMDELQYGYDDGPCLRAARENATYQVDDFRAEHRFGGYTTVVASQRIRSALAVPIPLHEKADADAGLNFYSTTPHCFDAADAVIAEQFGRAASASLSLAVRMRAAADKADDLHSAMKQRTIVDVAVGILMGQQRCAQAEAFSVLAATARARSMHISELAALVVKDVNGGSVSTHFDA